MMKLIKNKRGDIAVTLLVVGIVAVCVAALVSFQISKTRVQSSFINPDVLSNISVQMENFYLYINSGISEQQAANLIGAKLNGNRLTIHREQAGVMNVTYIVDLNKG